MANPLASPSASGDDYYQKTKSFFSDAVQFPEPDFGTSVRDPYFDSDEGEDPRIMADPAIAAAEPKHRRAGRTMFVTIGSIASFKDLIKEVLSDKFLEILAELKFTRLIVQCGPDLDFFEETRPQKGFHSHWIDILGFSYTDNMKSYLLKCTPSDGKVDGETRGRGIIVAHAGAGTVLEALNVNSRLIVVPNTTLMNNHQLELAEELEKQGYLIQGHLGKLHQDVDRMEQFEPANWPPKCPENASYRHLGDILQDLVPIKPVEEIKPTELACMTPEHQMWADMLANQPFPDGDPRHVFLNGQMSPEKREMFLEWRANWYKSHGHGHLIEEEEKARNEWKNTPAWKKATQSLFGLWVG